MRCGPEQPRIQTEIPGRSSVCSFSRTAHSFARSLTHSLVHSLTHSLVHLLTSLTPRLVGQWTVGWLFVLCFFLFWTIVRWRLSKNSLLCSVPLATLVHRKLEVNAIRKCQKKWLMFLWSSRPKIWEDSEKWVNHTDHSLARLMCLGKKQGVCVPFAQLPAFYDRFP